MHLLAMVSTFYEGVAELDNILDQEPTPDTVARAIALMARPEQQRYFFARLQNPAWLEPLKKKVCSATRPCPEGTQTKVPVGSTIGLLAGT